MTFRISVISPTATYSLARSVNPMNEGAIVTITLTTTGVQDGQSLPFTVSGTGITAADFVGLPTLSGAFVVQNGTASITLTTRADLTVEGLETFTVSLENGASISVDINDTSAVQPAAVWTFRAWGAAPLGNSKILALTWGNNQFVGVNEAGQAMTSPTGASWTLRPSLASAFTNNPAKAVTWSGTQYIAGGANANIATSPDGVTWTLRPGLATLWGASYNAEGVAGLCYGNGLYVAVGGNNTGGRIATSPDGVTWTNRCNAAPGNFYCVAWNGSMFVAAGGTTNNSGVLLYSSPDGITWTQREVSSEWNGTVGGRTISWNGTQWLLGGTSGQVATSPTGITWTNRPQLTTTGFGQSAVNVTWAGDRYVAAGFSGRLATSSDGITWTYSNALITLGWPGSWNVETIAWNGSSLMVGGHSGAIASSP